MADYRVDLDIYNGPLDLLLYLIRREEVDIYDIPLARITEQYVQYVQMLQKLDPNLAGEFLVVAATLMEIKTRMLLPGAPGEEGDDEGIQIDPRAELVRQLLEYKAFKDAADDLRHARDLQAMKYPRQPARPDQDEAELDLEDVQVWNLFDAFSKLMEATGQRLESHEIIHDDTPVELHAADILDRLGRDGAMTFADIFAGRTLRGEIVGLFLALLELIRQRKILAKQGRNFTQIQLDLNPNPPTPQELEAQARPVRPKSKPASKKPAPVPDAPPPPDADPGSYVSDAPAGTDKDDKDDTDDTEPETQGAGA